MSVSTGRGVLRALALQRNARLALASHAQQSSVRLFSAKDGADSGDKPEDGKQPGLMSTIFGYVQLSPLGAVDLSWTS